MDTTLFTLIDASTTVLTPNRRLSATLQQGYQQHQLQAQQTVWQTPDILPLATWLERSWNEYVNQHVIQPPLLLNSLQEQFLWEKIISQAKASAELLQVSETADMAKTAWSLLKQWQVNLDDLNEIHTEESNALHEWIDHYQTLCAKNNWLDTASLPDRLIEVLQQKKQIPPKKLILVGFTELAPQLKRLFSTCEQQGSLCREVATNENTLSLNCNRISVIDQEQEIVSMARWAKSLLAQDKTATIGCVIPKLDKIRDRVLQLFSDVFNDEDQMLFNLSAGKSLSHYPIIHTALQLLHLHKTNISAEIFNYLLNSPFLGEAETERMKRAHFDVFLRKKNISTIEINKLIADPHNTDSLSLKEKCPHLAKRLTAFLTKRNATEKELLHSEWSHLFIELLTLLGWPGERSLNSDEYQIVENWFKLLNSFKTLDQLFGRVSFQKALKNLYKITSKTPFQPKTPIAPIQILGLLEAAGLSFDYLWVAGMDDLSWPPQPRPHPLIPKNIQRQLNMPHATALRELLFCTNLTQQFMHDTQQTIFSHAEKQDDLVLQPSPLIRHLKLITMDSLNLSAYQSSSEKIYATKAMEYIIDETAPAFITQEKILGGINVLKQQAQCPFKSFAEWRLYAHELEKTLPGLRAKDRGTLIHKVLEMIWNTLKDHATLKACTESELNQIITDSIQKACLTSTHASLESHQYMTLEKIRLHKLMHHWLQIEKEREPFNVLINEKSTEITLQGLTFSIRIDRVDELADGKKLIIDYKTGRHNDINSWFSDRPEEPQLPLYALLDPQHTVGISFAQIASGDCGFKGLSEYSLDIKGIKLLSETKKTTALSWSEQMNQWKNTLQQLSDDFYHGVATVAPKEEDKTCLWCALKPLCRINEEITDEKH